MHSDLSAFFAQAKKISLTQEEHGTVLDTLQERTASMLSEGEKNDFRTLLGEFTEHNPLRSVLFPLSTPRPLPVWLGTNLLSVVRPFRL